MMYCAKTFYANLRTLFSAYILFILYLAFIYGLGSYALFNNNEGLYAQVPWEMLQTKNFIIPSLNSVPYIEKPPLLYWLIAICYKLLGVSEFSARLIPALTGLSLTLITAYFALVNKGKLQAYTTIILFASSISFLIFSRTVYFDIMFTLWISITLISFFAYWQTKQNKFLYIAYSVGGLAVLTKGLLAIILIKLVLLVFLATTKTPFKNIIKFLNFKATMLFLLICLPWHIMAMMQDKNFAWFYFVNEHLG